MQSSFRPVALRLSLSDVAALAEATARALLQRSPRLAFAFHLRLPAAGSGAGPAPTGKPEARPGLPCPPGFERKPVVC